MRKILFGLIFACLTGFGCATAPQSPAQAVYAVQGNYAAALSVAVAYKQLPACQQGGPVLCSDSGVVKKLQAADDSAYAALTAAQNVVRSPGAGLNAQTAIVAAQNAVNILAALTANLKVQP